MNIIFTIIIIIVLILVLILFLPIHYDFKLKKDGELNVVTDINYPFDIIRFHLEYFLLMKFNLKLFGIKALDKTIDLSYKDDKSKKKKDKKSDDKDGKNKKGLAKNVLSLSLKEKLKLISDLKKDLSDTIKKIKPKYDNIMLDIGFNNPFLLGVLLAALSPIKLLLKNMKVYPHFTEKIFKIDMELRSDINLFTLIIIVLKFRFSKNYKKLFD